MPHLAYDTNGTPHAGRLARRALIGRGLSHGVSLSDPGVGRLHAWVDPTPDGGWVVADAGSRAGLTVNGRRVTDRHVLGDGDVIGVAATRIRFAAADDLPAGAEPVTLSPPPGQPVRTTGILFACGTCAAPIWVGPELAGKLGRCRHCHQRVRVPTPAAAAAAPVAEPLAEPSGDRPPQCGVCHAAIGPGDGLTSCPECDTTYHAECWAENHGCSTYGCGQVDVLNPAPPATVPATPNDEPEAEAGVATESPVAPPADEPPAGPATQWEWVMVLAALVAAAAGALLWGALSAVVGVVATVMLVRRRPGTRVGLLVVAVALAVIGVFAGLAASDEWHFAGRHLP